MISIPQSENVHQHFEAPYSARTSAIIPSFNSPSIALLYVCLCASMCVCARAHIRPYAAVSSCRDSSVCIHVVTSPSFPGSRPPIILNEMKRAGERCMHELIGLNRSI